MFSCATAPLHSPGHFLTGVAWLYLHQLMCNVSNQARTGDEDSVNKPWRPLPTRRLTEVQAVVLRWAIAVLCICASLAFGHDVAATSAATVLVTFVYDELGLSDHYIGKNLCNIGGYTMLEVGTTKLMGTISSPLRVYGALMDMSLIGVSRDLDATATTAICISGVLIFTTIQTQDFADVVGDQAKGRVTFPIYAPEASRVATLIAVTSWSLILPVFWGIGPLFSAVIMALGGFVGMRYFVFRSPEKDKFSYILYNVSSPTLCTLDVILTVTFSRSGLCASTYCLCTGGLGHSLCNSS